ncbi:hypothetical protein IscW_ISCW015813 [Ixodes scapularis]|uniref:Uncharacterized protein n=1 Tax=Ixodes scapularis TaxID=6945 RepID=B7P4E8_IXOSC|nr:hypothetical protein IscW_ISCW015813 [Ixodes scapularis]|eukprot:XP_002405914.1 hypothetical protein IscW_ISCW015813 [Ixodes scapularis]
MAQSVADAGTVTDGRQRGGSSTNTAHRVKQPRQQSSQAPGASAAAAANCGPTAGACPACQWKPRTELRAEGRHGDFSSCPLADNKRSKYRRPLLGGWPTPDPETN